MRCLEIHRRMMPGSTDPERLRNRMIARNEQAEHDFGTDDKIMEILLGLSDDDRMAALNLLPDEIIERLFLDDYLAAAGED